MWTTSAHLLWLPAAAGEVAGPSWRWVPLARRELSSSASTRRLRILVVTFGPTEMGVGARIMAVGRCQVVGDFFKVLSAGPLFFVSSWLLMIFSGIVYKEVGIRPFGYLTSMVVTIGLWLGHGAGDRGGDQILGQGEEISTTVRYQVFREALEEYLASTNNATSSVSESFR